MIRFILFILVIFAFIHLCSADDMPSDDDIFNTSSFDSSLTTSISADSTNALSYLPGVVFVAQSAATLLDSMHYGADTRFFGSVFLKASKNDVGALYASCRFNYFLFAATDNKPQEQRYKYQSPNSETPSITVSEYHFSTDINKVVFARIGKQLLGWGASYFWSPTDFINRERVQTSAISPVDIRGGKPGMRLHIPLPNANLLFFTDFSDITNKSTARAFGKHVAQAWRLDATIAGVNIGTVGYAAQNRPLHLGLDATSNIFASDIYTEAAFSIATQEDQRNAFSMSIGAARVVGQDKNWTLRAEIYYNDTGYGNTDLTQLPPGSFTPLYSGKYYAYGEISGSNLVSGTVNATLYGCVNAADGSYSPGAQCTIDLPGVVPFTLFTRYFGGNKNREFTTPYQGNALSSGIRVMVML